MKVKKLVLFVLVLAAILPSVSCYKVLIHSKDKDQEPVTELYGTSIEEAMKVGREALIRLGYRIEREETTENTLYTGWQSAKATSHYIDLFDRRDYGTVGAYYRLKLTAEERAGKTQVAVSAPTRAIVTGRLKSSFREEKRVLKKIRDLLRTDDFEITNVGVEEK